MNIAHKRFYKQLLLACAVSTCWTNSPAAQERAELPDSRSLAELSLEDLGNIEITSVSRKAQKVSEAAASIFVITREDIRRTGVTNLPEALRLAPNLQVAQISSSQYAISARGFNTSTANKMQVLIDGRSVYTPLYSGVFWDVQDVLLEDVDRIEVISGPGGTMWGSNAVNGVINIRTRSAYDTQGTTLVAGSGTEDRGLVEFRHGGKFAETGAYRVYGKYTDQDSTVLANGNSAEDSWNKSQAGFRTDWNNATDSFTVQGDAYQGTSDQRFTGTNLAIDGANLLSRWQRQLTKNSNLQLQIYYDHTNREIPRSGAETRNTFDVDFQHQFNVAKNHDIVWGGGYRSSKDHVQNTAGFAFIPEKRTLDTSNLFAQDSIALFDNKAQLTLGSKFEHNSYTGLEIQPNIRLGWKLSDRQFAWAAISRAVRTPSRIDRDIFVPPSSRFPFNLIGGPDFQSETLTAYEAGYRTQPNSRLSVVISTFYNVYKRIRTLTPVPGTTGNAVINNGEKGDTYGAEMWADFYLTASWRLKAGYAYLEEDLRVDPGSIMTNETDDAKHRFLFRSSMDLTPNIELDGTLTHVSAIPAIAVPAYTGMDIRLGWRANKTLEISLTGRNLLDQQHSEFGTTAERREIQRSALLKAVWKF
ncbi:MAG: TonB-dependent receptor [Pseudomonadota bacterium]